MKAGTQNAASTPKFLSVWTLDRSYIYDFAASGRDTGEVNETIEVWLSIGQDQANILRKLIDERNFCAAKLSGPGERNECIVITCCDYPAPDVAIGQDDLLTRSIRL